MDDRTYLEPLDIGHSNDGELVKAMHRAEQRVMLFVIGFEELPPPPESRDYRLCLDRLWTPFLTNTGLSASISNAGWHPDRGLAPSVMGHVWRQHGTDRLGTLTELEMLHLSDLLRAPHSRVTRFTLSELITTDQFGRPQTRRKFCLLNGAFSVESNA
jgi:hypothetical protein